jgi:arginine decarboxylase
VVAGDTVTDVLQYVSYSREELLTRLRSTVERALQAKRITLEDSRQLLRIYEAGLSSYTYLEADRPYADLVTAAGAREAAVNGTVGTRVP